MRWSIIYFTNEAGFNAYKVFDNFEIIQKIAW